MSSGFQVPPYPYDRLDPLKEVAAGHDGGAVNLSIGAPCDAPPPQVIEALSSSGLERGYPPSIGTAEYRAAASDWLSRRFGIDTPSDQLAACIGTKEFVATTPHYLHLRDPQHDTVLYPAISYPSYAMGADLAGCRSVAVPVDDAWRIDLSQVSDEDAERALCLWVNTPGNPAGGLDDLEAVARWARERDILVLSDECYIEFTWGGHTSGGSAQHGASILEQGTNGVLAVHSLSKRSNMAGVRAGFYAGDQDLVHYLSEVRKHAGNLVPGPVQAAAIAAWNDDAHVDAQRDIYFGRLNTMKAILEDLDLTVELPGGGFYLWVEAPDGDAWALTERLASDLGVVVSPGEFYGAAGAGHVRLALVQPEKSFDLIRERMTA